MIASGGISSSTDMNSLHDLNRPNLVGAIVGKALYEGRVTLKELEQ
jgi:phosphoribosylformimino-5-aminoimidazole carboxamide ribotide isomerase